MLLLGYDIGSSSIKASLFDTEEGKSLSHAASPGQELPIDAPQPGWAEQNPQMWWTHLKKATRKLLADDSVKKGRVGAIGISYQMHGLVVVDKHQKVLRPAIIWCDGRAVEIGSRAYDELGHDFCKTRFLNSPGNFTASKLRWVKENEPEIYQRIHKFMLPGDYIAMKLTGEIMTSSSGLSEAILWDHKDQELAKSLLAFYGIEEGLVPKASPNFSDQGQLTSEAASELGLPANVSVTYRAGDQPNNALSLNVMEPGEAAATAGTSGVIYGIADQPAYDDFSRVNTFLHVNHSNSQPRYGVLLCINGTGIQYSWLKNKMFNNSYGYEQMNRQAAKIPIGAEGVVVLPFGNGPERVLGNQDPGAQFKGVDFNRHGRGHLIRAAQEGIAFSLNYGLGVMNQMGMEIDIIRVSHDNMFQSPVFREAFTNATGMTVELYDTSGALGAALGAGIGAGIYENRNDAFKNIEQIDVIDPDPGQQQAYQQAYGKWEQALQREIHLRAD